MRYLLCPKQAAVKTELRKQLDFFRHALITGNDLTGKTTVANYLSFQYRSNGASAVFLNSCLCSTFPTLQHAAVSALGLPKELGASKKIFKVLENLVESKSEWYWFVDDVDILLHGEIAGQRVSLKFIRDLLSIFPKLRIVGTCSLSNVSEVLVKDFLKSETGVVKIGEWIDVSELRNFLSHIAAHFNLTPYQLSDEEFLSELIIKSKGASGDVIRHMKVLSLASNKLQGRLLTKDCLRAIWAY